MYKIKPLTIDSYLFFLLAALFFTTGCKKERNEAPKGEFERGVFIINEGSFLNSNGEISFYDRQTKSVSNKLFEAVNKRPLGGDVVQSMHIVDETGYIVCNNSNKIEIVNANTFTSLGVIENLALPRYMVAANNKGYVSEWVNFGVKGRISVIDLTTNTITKTIEVGRMPEQMTIVNNKLYVANSDENTITVIDLSDETILKTLSITDSPKEFRLDANAKIWVLCGGKTVYDNNPPDYVDEVASTPGALVSINPLSDNTELTILFPSVGSLDDLQINGQRNKLYYSYAGAVYTHDITAANLSTTPLIKRSFYGTGIDPVEDIFYGAQSSFTGDGKVVRFNSTTGAAIDSVTVTIGPNGFVFR